MLATLLEDLLASATKLGEVSSDITLEEFLPRVEAYLIAVQKLRVQLEKEVPSLSQAERDDLRPLLEQLTSIHEEVTLFATEKRERLADEIIAIQRRVQGFRMYVDRLPSRINLTGQRKG